MKQPQISLALTQHQINWWDNFNIKLFEKILEQKNKIKCNKHKITNN